MKITELVAKHISYVVHGNWTEIYLDDVISDITYQEATALPTGVTNSIAMLLYHLKFYNEILGQRLEGKEPFINQANGFDVVVHSDEDWRRLKSETIQSFETLASTVAALPDEKLWPTTPAGDDTFYKALHGIAEHAHYHLGQIVVIKKILRA